MRRLRHRVAQVLFRLSRWVDPHGYTPDVDLTDVTRMLLRLSNSDPRFDPVLFLHAGNLPPTNEELRADRPDPGQASW